jgi:hypothetical protein
MSMSPFRVDCTGEVTDLSKESYDESIDASDVVDMETSDTNSETEVPLNEEMEFQLDDYESARVQQPRTMVQLRMPASHRDSILKSQGFSLAERNQGKKMANITKSRRKRTSETMALSKAAEVVEIWKRATKNATWGRKQKQRERAYLQTLCSSSSGALNGKDSIESIELS